jgi:hypothetical protein
MVGYDAVQGWRHANYPYPGHVDFYDRCLGFLGGFFCSPAALGLWTISLIELVFFLLFKFGGGS